MTRNKHDLYSSLGEVKAEASLRGYLRQNRELLVSHLGSKCGRSSMTVGGVYDYRGGRLIDILKEEVFGITAEMEANAVEQRTRQRQAAAARKLAKRQIVR